MERKAVRAQGASKLLALEADRLKREAAELEDALSVEDRRVRARQEESKLYALSAAQIGRFLEARQRPARERLAAWLERAAALPTPGLEDGESAAARLVDIGRRLGALGSLGQDARRARE